MKTIYYKHLDQTLLNDLENDFEKAYSNLSNEQKLEIINFMKAVLKKYISVSSKYIQKSNDIINNYIKLYGVRCNSKKRDKKINALKLSLDIVKNKRQKEINKFNNQYDLNNSQDLFNYISFIEHLIMPQTKDLESFEREYFYKVTDANQMINENDFSANENLSFGVLYRSLNNNFTKALTKCIADCEQFKIKSQECLDKIDKIFPEFVSSEEFDYDFTL